jgi:hypothetical protein
VAYAAWHVYLKFIKKADVSHAVWLVAGLMTSGLLPDVITTTIAYATAGAPRTPSMWIGFVQLTFSVLWALGLLLLARGFWVVAPGLSDAGRVHLQQLAILGGVVVLGLFVSALPVPPNVGLSIRLCSLILLVSARGLVSLVILPLFSFSLRLPSSL